MVALSDVAEINPRMPDAVRRGSLDAATPFLAMSSVGEDGTADYATSRSLGELLKGYTYFERGDVLIAKITPCFENGKAVHLADLPSAFGFGSTEFHVIRPGRELDGRYLFHALSNEHTRARGAARMTGSAGQKRIPAEFLRQFEMRLPDLQEQRRIATILDKCRAIMEARRSSERSLDELRGALVAEYLNKNRDSWATLRLGDIGAISGGLQVTPARADLSLEVPYLRVANVFRDALDLEQMKSIRLSSSELGRTRLIASDLLIVEGHGNPSEIGRCAVWNGSIDPCVHQNHLIRLRLDMAQADPVYVSAFLNSPEGRRQMLRFGKTTSGLNTISTSDVGRVRIALPPLAHQKRLRAQLARLATIRERAGQATLDSERLARSIASTLLAPPAPSNSLALRRVRTTELSSPSC